MGDFNILLRNCFSFNLGDEFFEFLVHLKVDRNQLQGVKIWLRILGIKYTRRWWFIKYYSLIYNVFSFWSYWLLINFILKWKFNFWKRHWENWILKDWGFIKVKDFTTWNYFDAYWWRKILKQILISLKNTLIFCLIVAFDYLSSFDFAWNVLVNKFNNLYAFDFISCWIFLPKL